MDSPKVHQKDSHNQRYLDAKEHIAVNASSDKKIDASGVSDSLDLLDRKNNPTNNSLDSQKLN